MGDLSSLCSPLSRQHFLNQVRLNRHGRTILALLAQCPDSLGLFAFVVLNSAKIEQCTRSEREKGSDRVRERKCNGSETAQPLHRVQCETAVYGFWVIFFTRRDIARGADRAAAAPPEARVDLLLAEDRVVNLNNAVGIRLRGSSGHRGGCDCCAPQAKTCCGSRGRQGYAQSVRVRLAAWRSAQ
jgi:hypothetical protein